MLFDSALAGSEQASGQGGGALVPGRRADLVMLDGERNVLLGHGPQTALDAWILGGTQNPVRDVMVAGKWIIRDGRHPKKAAIRAAYRDCIARITQCSDSLDLERNMDRSYIIKGRGATSA